MDYVKLDLQNRTPAVEILPDRRRRVTRVYDVLNYVPKTPAEMLADVQLPWGTADITYSDCLLIKQDIPKGQNDNPAKAPNDPPPQLVRIYEQIDPVLETAVGNADVTVGQDDLITVTQSYLQFSVGTAIYQIPGVTLAPSPWTQCVLKLDERTDDGTLRRIKRTYISKGIISQTDEEHNDGALLMRSVTYVNQVPPTPSGYILISQKVEYPNGLPVYSYTFAKGNGQISSQTEYRLSPDQGTTGVTVTTIKYLTDPSVNTNPITGPGGSELIAVTYQDSDGHRMWDAIYSSGQGVISSDVETRHMGALKIYTKTSINAAPTAPTATIGGTVVLITASQRNGTRFEDGTIIYDYKWAEGNGTISDTLTHRIDGLREETIVSLGTRTAPAGIVIRDEVQESDGYPVYTVTSMQTASGGSDPTAATLTLPRKVPFKYPGRAKAYSELINSVWTAIDVFLAPPVEVLLDGSVVITYQTSASIGSIGTSWQPTDWATINARWYGLGGYPRSHIAALEGYRSVSATPITHTFGSLDTNGGTMLGQTAFGGSYGILTVTGGPADPVGNTYTVHAALEVAFTSTTGVVWYRKTVVSTGVVPAQAALPV